MHRSVRRALNLAHAHTAHTGLLESVIAFLASIRIDGVRASSVHLPYPFPAAVGAWRVSMSGDHRHWSEVTIQRSDNFHLGPQVAPSTCHSRGLVTLRIALSQSESNRVVRDSAPNAPSGLDLKLESGLEAQEVCRNGRAGIEFQICLGSIDCGVCVASKTLLCIRSLRSPDRSQHAASSRAFVGSCIRPSCRRQKCRRGSWTTSALLRFVLKFWNQNERTGLTRTSEGIRREAVRRVRLFHPGT